MCPLTSHPSVRSTNVYEEKSLGIYAEDEDEEDEEDEIASAAARGSRMTVWSRYLAMHARKQLAFGTCIMLSNFRHERPLIGFVRYVVVGFGFVFGVHRRGLSDYSSIAFCLVIAD